jgi:transposase InsO family protein
MDFFTVPTLRFQILYIFVILNHSRRQVVHFAVTPHPTTAWVIQQLREAMPFGQQPIYLFRDNDGIYGDEVGRFLAGTGIAEVKTAHRCPWQNPFVERYGGTLRQELLDHVIVLNEEHLKRLLKDFIEEYYHLARPHQGLNGDTPVLRAKPEPAANAHSAFEIKPGMTREDVLRVFTTEGGLSFRTQQTYVLKGCPYIHVDVEFSPVRHWEL